jgi:hypothetical protein
MGRKIQDIVIEDVLDNAAHHDAGASLIEVAQGKAVTLNSDGGTRLAVYLDASGEGLLMGNTGTPDAFTITYSPTTPFAALIAAFRL